MLRVLHHYLPIRKAVLILSETVLLTLVVSAWMTAHLWDPTSDVRLSLARELPPMNQDDALVACFKSALFLSVLVLGEIRQGIEQKRKRDAQSAHILELWLNGLETTFADRLLAIDSSVADAWGRLNALRPMPVADGLLAATALVHGLTLVTRNTDDFAKTRVSLLNPFAQ